MQHLRGSFAATLSRCSLCLAPAAFAVGCAATQPATGSATLTWTRTTTNTNGSPLLNLAGFRIEYGVSPDTLKQSITVADPAATSYTLEDLASGTWYFAISVFTTAGTSSTRSAVVSKTIR